jgi:hypothetical protein
VNPRVPIYAPAVQKRVEMLNERISSGDPSAYAELTHLAALYSGLPLTDQNIVTDRVITWNWWRSIANLPEDSWLKRLGSKHKQV